MNKYQARFVESVLKKVIDGTYTKSKAYFYLQKTNNYCGTKKQNEIYTSSKPSVEEICTIKEKDNLVSDNR